MTLAPASSPPPSLARAIMQRTRGRTHGPATRLMSPSDFGEILKPFVFLDLFDHEGTPFSAGLHPHSGIATLTYIAEGSVSYIDPDNVKGTVAAGGVEWMQAGPSSRRGPTLNSFWARPSRTSTISSSAPTRSTRRPPRCAMPSRTFCRYGRASFKKAVCKHILHTTEHPRRLSRTRAILGRSTNELQL